MTIDELVAQAVACALRSELEELRDEIARLRELFDRGQVPRRRLTREETADHYSVSVRTIDGWIAAGAPVLRLGGPGGSPRMDPVELDAWHRRRSFHVVADARHAEPSQ